MLQATTDKPSARRGERTTRVCFPRFEYEHVTTGKLEARSESKAWLTHDEVQSLLNPRAAVAERHVDLKGMWWGVYHKAKERITYGDMYPELPGETCGQALFRCRVLEHEYLWDEQAVKGYATQVVLEQLVRSSFIDLAAIRIKRRGWSPDNSPKQELVGRIGNGEWWGMSEGDVSRWCCSIMLDLCQTSSDDFHARTIDYLATVDNRGGYL